MHIDKLSTITQPPLIDEQTRTVLEEDTGEPDLVVTVSEELDRALRLGATSPRRGYS